MKRKRPKPPEPPSILDACMIRNLLQSSRSELRQLQREVDRYADLLPRMRAYERAIEKWEREHPESMVRIKVARNPARREREANRRG